MATSMLSAMIPDKAAVESRSLSGPNGHANQMSSWIARAAGATPSHLYDIYDVDTRTVLGAGSFGKVLMGRNKATGHTCAIKQIAKASRRKHWTQKEQDARERAASLKQEVYIMEKLDHRNIIRLVGKFEDDLNNYLVMQLCVGGKVTDFISQMQDYRESDAAVLMQQVFEAIGYMHKMEIVHRDVKPDNMLLESRNPIKDNTLKIVDFGLSVESLPGRSLRQFCGTAGFMSPQAIDGRYDLQTDMWSCGASMYELLSGQVPFRAETDAGIFAAVRRGNFTFAEADWRHVSEDAKDLIRSLLKMNPRERFTANRALEHIWIRKNHGAAPLQRTVSRFSERKARRERPQPEAEASQLPDVRVALSEVTSWVNSFLPQSSKLSDESKGPGRLWL